MRGLANGYHEDTIEGVEIVKVFADAEDAALAVYVTREGAFDGSVLYRRSEDFAVNVAHAPELLVARRRDRRHGGDYKVVSR